MAARHRFGFIGVALAIYLAIHANAAICEDAADLRKKGIEALKASQTNPDSLVAAARYFAKASALYEANGQTDLAVETNSYLYWCKKNMTLKDIDSFLKSGETVVTERLSAVESKTVAATDAQSWLDRADDFSKHHPDDPLLVAVRYFEVGDRFKDTDAGRKAIGLSLKAMQHMSAKFETYKASPTDGKVFVKSEPPGATIILLAQDNRKLDTGKVTPSLVELPVGSQTLELMLKTFKSKTLQVYVAGGAILKPDIVKLDPITVSVDLVFEEGWRVFVDGHAATPSKSNKAETPCTVELPLGIHEIGLGKLGFYDIHQKIEIVEAGVVLPGKSPTTTLEIKAAPGKGPGTLLIRNLLTLIDPAKDAINGQWRMQNGQLMSDTSVRPRLQIPYHPPEEYDFTVEFKLSIGRLIVFILPGPNTQFEYQIGFNNKAGFEMVSGKRADSNLTTMPFAIEANRKYKLTVKVRKDSVSAAIDGKLMSELKTDYGNFSVNRDWRIPDRLALAVTSDLAFAVFSSITVTEISGPGEEIRK